MEKNRNTILCFYAILSLVVILCGVMDFTLQNMGYTLVMIELIVAYIARSRFPRNESYEENHTTYIIRTIWIYSTIAAIGMVGLAFIIIQQGSLDAINALANSMVEGMTPDDAQMEAAFKQYISDNEDLIRQQYILWLFPAQLYLVWRILKGGSRAFKGYRIANPKKFL